MLEASWSGFTDAQSGINNYMVQFFQQVCSYGDSLCCTMLLCLHSASRAVMLTQSQTFALLPLALGSPGPVHVCLTWQHYNASPAFLLQATNRSLPSFNVTPAMDAGLLTQVSVAVNTTPGRAYFARVSTKMQACHTLSM